MGAGYWLTDFDAERDTDTKFESYDFKLPGPANLPQVRILIAFGERALDATATLR